MTKATSLADGQRTKSERLTRIVLAIFAVFGLFFSVSDSLANVLMKRDPEQARSLAPWDGTITAKLAEQKMAVRPASLDSSEPAKLARLAVRQDATTVDALVVLGLQAQLRSQTDAARKIFAHSLELSRRELEPQIWAIEEAVSRGDIRTALANYDIALRTSQSASRILFPVLESALREPKVRTQLVTILSTEPVWLNSFVKFAAIGRANPEATAQFFQEAGAAGITIADADRTSIVNAIASRQRIEEAWEYYSSFRKGAVRSRSRDPRFQAALERPSLFDWRVHNSPGISATIQRDANGGAVEFSAAPSTAGLVLDQVQVLPPGTYRFDTKSIDVEQPDRSRPYWILTCKGGRELGRLSLANSANAVSTDSTEFVVPPDCKEQKLALFVRLSNEITGVYGRILTASLVPLS